MLLFAFISSISVASARSLATCTCIHFNVSGSFQTPNYPRSKPVSSSTCILYSFIAPADHIIEILFNSFEFPPRTERLFDDIPDGSIDEHTAYSGEFCGREIEPGRKFISLSNHFVFHVQFSGITRGFQGVHKFISNERFHQNATEIQPCRYSIEAAEGNVFSPQYPHYYPSNSNCTYFFPMRKAHKLMLKLKLLDFRPFSCSTDYIDIYQMHPKIHLDKLCYDSIPPYSLSSTKGFILEFHSGSNQLSKNRGFHFWFKYFREAKEDNSESSQATPFAYSASHAQIKSKSLCPVRITSPSMNTGPNAISSAQMGIINSSIYSFNDEPFKCQFIFMGSGNERVHITFLQFNLFDRLHHSENSSMRLVHSIFNSIQFDATVYSKFRCDQMDHVTAHILIGTRMSRIDDFCGSETPPKLMSTKNLMTLEYVVRSTKSLRKMTPSKEHYGFVIQYEFRTDLGLSAMNADRNYDHVCYYVFNSSRHSYGSIFSPNHPGYYPRNIDCHYVFHGSEKEIVVIHFEYFDVEGFATFVIRF
ncbi:unnamed protein product [Anisakis simplex]|uniref:Suppressor of lurcher protein 1 (inferred by orthology to a C. elegans protein) n=1 Tax=Anisakis simplex TaxID=6269 RepID=A0A0M3K078_ANISI|nr:unnamed protein product [Anisakis simplex]